MNRAKRLFLQPFVRRQPVRPCPEAERFDLSPMSRDDASDFRPRQAASATKAARAAAGRSRLSPR